MLSILIASSFLRTRAVCKLARKIRGCEQSQVLAVSKYPPAGGLLWQASTVQVETKKIGVVAVVFTVN